MCTNEQLAVLYHEAGHAVVGYAAGMKIAKISVDKTKSDWTGQVEPNEDDCKNYTDDQWAKYFLAGGEAENVLCVNKNIKLNDSFYKSFADGKKAEKYVLAMLELKGRVEDLSEDQYELFNSNYESLQQTVNEIVKKQWGIIVVIAERLKKDDTLENDVLGNILSGCN